MHEWYAKKISSALAVTNATLTNQAKELASYLGLEKFKCSVAYLNNFRKRRNQTLSWRTHLMQKCSDEVYVNVEKFIKNLFEIKFNHFKQSIVFWKDKIHEKKIHFINMVFEFVIIGWNSIPFWSIP